MNNYARAKQALRRGEADHHRRQRENVAASKAEDERVRQVRKLRKLQKKEAYAALEPFLAGPAFDALAQRMNDKYGYTRGQMEHFYRRMAMEDPKKCLAWMDKAEKGDSSDV